jgi:hypothetical protein
MRKLAFIIFIVSTAMLLLCMLAGLFFNKYIGFHSWAITFTVIAGIFFISLGFVLTDNKPTAQ